MVFTHVIRGQSHDWTRMTQATERCALRRWHVNTAVVVSHASARQFFHCPCLAAWFIRRSDAAVSRAEDALPGTCTAHRHGCTCARQENCRRFLRALSAEYLHSRPQALFDVRYRRRPIVRAAPQTPACGNCKLYDTHACLIAWLLGIDGKASSSSSRQ